MCEEVGGNGGEQWREQCGGQWIAKEQEGKGRYTVGYIEADMWRRKDCRNDQMAD